MADDNYRQNELNHVWIVADYAEGDLAFKEVGARITSIDRSVVIHDVPVPAFKTVSAGFVISQLALNFGGVGWQYIFANVAPRKDDPNHRLDNEGEKLVYVELNSGTKIVAVNSGYTLSFIRDFIQKIFSVEVSNNGSQFRSRDYYPDAVCDVTSGRRKLIGREIDVDIPEPPKYTIAYVDNFGNIKTTVPLSSLEKDIAGLKRGDTLGVEIDGILKNAFYGKGIFDVREGGMIVAPGSSGRKNDKFVEISIRGGSAIDAFEYQDRQRAFETKVKISKRKIR